VNYNWLKKVSGFRVEGVVLLALALQGCLIAVRAVDPEGNTVESAPLPVYGIRWNSGSSRQEIYQIQLSDIIWNEITKKYEIYIN
jgi:hypothetical protein